MESPQSVTQAMPTRQESLASWLREHREQGFTLAKLAAGARIHLSCLSRMFDQDTMPVRHHAYLVSRGVPAELLPRAEDKRPGRKPSPPRIPHDEAMAAFRCV